MILKRVFVGLGEVLWDLLPEGRRLGGAPANFAYACAALGGEGVVASRVGDDEDGRKILAELRGIGLSTHHVQIDPDHPTGTVPVALDAAGQPTFTIIENVAYDYMAMTEALAELAERADCICFGSLAQRRPESRNTIRQVLERAAGALRVYDVNLRQHFYSEEILRTGVSSANVLKLNDDELTPVCERVGINAGSMDEQAKRLIGQHDLKLVAVTMGADGCCLYSPTDKVRSAGYQVEVRDTVGSGDAFAASLATDLLVGTPLDEVADRANLVGAYVATQSGATTPITEARLKQLTEQGRRRM